MFLGKREMERWGDGVDGVDGGDEGDEEDGEMGEMGLILNNGF
jgi:hypothetical protein